MRTRAVAAALSLLAVASTRGNAGLPCQVVRDALGDADVASVALPAAVANVAGYADLDISSGDVASNGIALTAVIRVARYSPGSPKDALGRMYLASFTSNRVRDQFGNPAELFLLWTERALDPGRASWGMVDKTFGVGNYAILGNAVAVVDAGRSEIRMTLPLDVAPGLRTALASPSSALTDLTLRTFLYRGDPTGTTTVIDGAPVDDATAHTVYHAGAPTCVRVGS